VVVGNALETALAQRRRDRIGVGTPDLVRSDRIAGLDQLVAGRDHDDAGLAAHAHARHAGRGGDRNLGRMQNAAGAEQQRALAAIAGAPMHEAPWCGHETGVDFDIILLAPQLFDRHDHIAAARQHRAGHDGNAAFVRYQRRRRFAGSLGRLHAKAPPSGRGGLGGECDAVHDHAIEGGLIALGVDVLAQHRAGALAHRQGFDRQARQVRADEPFCTLRIEHGRMVQRAERPWCRWQDHATIRIPRP
jgi:hypothetical protein